MSKRPDRVEFAMTDGHMRHYYADGKVEEVKWKAGDVKWSERATYQQENIGTSEFRVRVVQLKYGAGETLVILRNAVDRSIG
ncbi:MAG TPA: hypothetical protein VFP47_07665 [Pyrinomonadaceae bacterium]|nr:hypothetical protein [Pyrinomonadaceae bacterium]